MMRVREHIILGTLDESNTVTIYFEGKPITALEGETIASALINAGIKAFRHTHKERQYRGIFCGIGRCTDCVMIVDGQPNVRTCVTPVQDGMRIDRQIGLGKWGADL
jgi:predicted molibdopterin-dependent oxidoreductase YjgC